MRELDITTISSKDYVDGLVQDCSNPIANTLELLQSCTKPSIYVNDHRLMAKLYAKPQQSRPKWRFSPEAPYA